MLQAKHRETVGDRLWLGAGYLCFAGGLVLLVKTCTGCSPAQQETAKVQAIYTVEEGAHATEISKCLADAKHDGGFEAFCRCWNEKNAKYHVDAGVECAR